MYRPRARFRREEIARINHFIRVPEVRVISEDGEQLGVMTTDKAIALAREAGQDLVEIAPKAKPPVTKIMDYGKYKYEQVQKAKLAKKKQTIIEVKEIKFRPKIGVGDYETKKRHVERFLLAGQKVKITIMFRGREMAHPELGRKILDKLAQDVAEFSAIESPAKQEGRNMVMVLGSTIKKLADEKQGETRETSIEQVKEESKRTSKEPIKEEPKEEPKELSKEVSKEQPKASKEERKEQSKEISKETVREEPKETRKEAGKKTADKKNEVVKELKKEVRSDKENA